MDSYWAPIPVTLFSSRGTEVNNMNNTKPYGPYMLVDRLVHVSAVSVQSLGEGKVNSERRETFLSMPVISFFFPLYVY